jgi:polysaccharide biosynthesis/export protein
MSKLLLFVIIALAANAQDLQLRPIPTTAIDPTSISNLPMQRVGQEDLLGLSVYGAPEFTRTIRVAADGTMRLPMLKQKIRVEGLFPSDVEVLVADALKREQIFVDPFVSVTVMEYHSRPISIMGAVTKPIIFQAVGNVSLLDALARAEGLNKEAGAEVIITRPNGAGNTPSVQRIPLRGLIDGTDPELNVKLTGGEEIRVPEVGKVVIWGNVRKPGVFPVQDSGHTSVMTTIAQAEGLSPYSSKVAYIYRPDNQGVKHEIPVDLDKILHRKAADITLQARDILYIPDNTGKRVTAQTLDRLAGFASATASGVLIWH